QHQQLQQPLPRQYRIESQAQLAKDLGEGSLPDVTVCQQIQRHGMMSREEVSRLSEARRLELLRLEERRRQGEIIIRLADLKDWCKEHLLLLFVFIINTGLAVLLHQSSGGSG
uniref:BMERB domain-containing protein n=1 Tax=Macrostomum lignano TaxID=282301 RepID=A0A1I8I9A8_9PLAT